MFHVNRSVAVIKPRQPFFDWLRNTPDWDLDLTLDNLRVDCTALLIPEFDEPEDAVNYVDERFEQIFEMELASWYEDKKLWPPKRDLKTFWEWFDVELHSVVVDVPDEDINETSIGVLH
jgi:hypothetical protein